MKKKQIELTLAEEYFEFVELFAAKGRIANSETSHSNFDEDDKKSVFEHLREYDVILNELQNKISKIKESAIQKFRPKISFWDKDWDDLTQDEVADYLAYRKIGLLCAENKETVKALYYSDSHKERL